jgi:hypothetical protein
MQVVYQCPDCQLLNYRDVGSTNRKLDCSACDWDRAFAETDLNGETPQRCLACGNDDLWRQKDFPQGLGLLMVATGATLSTIAYWQMEVNWAIGILLVFAAIDLVLYVAMPDVLVCYRCQSRHRKAKIAEDHPRFDLELNERYRQEEIRLAESKKQPDSE